jgi:hypothetical protein
MATAGTYPATASSTLRGLVGTPQPPQKRALALHPKPHWAHRNLNALPQFSQKRLESEFAV